MPVKRRLVPAQRLQPRSRAQARPRVEEARVADQPADEAWRVVGARAEAAEGEQFGAAAAGGGGAFPGLDEGPGALVDGVVDRDYARDGGGEGVGVGGGGGEGVFAQHGGEELVLRGVDPVAGVGVIGG